MFMITSFLTLLFALWMCAKIAKSNSALALGSFFFLPLAIIPLLQNWGDEENDIKVPFFLTLASSVYTVYSMMSFVGDPEEVKESLLQLAQWVA